MTSDIFEVLIYNILIRLWHWYRDWASWALPTGPAATSWELFILHKSSASPPHRNAVKSDMNSFRSSECRENLVSQNNGVKHHAAPSISLTGQWVSLHAAPCLSTAKNATAATVRTPCSACAPVVNDPPPPPRLETLCRWNPDNPSGLPPVPFLWPGFPP